ncbi:uncharacterized protein EKO05_0009557 [Ascochyta rabiei]|uniref:uncharacterized protein n=1 Tax=Didymella rabiei TaxID=5454 RepID=UPI0021FAE0AE|nr:uncharacterized protein EKO05_0009557 [Ascochyta rabiei]UPX19289.1 hypothetical protein EKO05_0009557 [Ascochyta rabiei]
MSQGEQILITTREKVGGRTINNNRHNKKAKRIGVRSQGEVWSRQTVPDTDRRSKVSNSSNKIPNLGSPTIHINHRMQPIPHPPPPPQGHTTPLNAVKPPPLAPKDPSNIYPKIRLYSIKYPPSAHVSTLSSMVRSPRVTTAPNRH